MLKVSVSMITYNQERFIAQAIESALAQQTTFEYEIVIGEDCSTDRTREIVNDYARKYPDKIRTFLHAHNLGLLGKNNFVATLAACRGQYIALLEGDDYWTDSNKLQKQVDFLDSHPDCAICFHNVTKTYEDGSNESSPYCRIDQRTLTSLPDLLAHNMIPTCSVLYRSKYIGEFPDWYFHLRLGDWPLHIFVAQHGDIGYIDELMAVYRLHDGGIYAGFSRAGRVFDTIKMLILVNSHLRFRFEQTIRHSILSSWAMLLAAYRKHDSKKGLLDQAIESVLQLFDQWPYDLQPSTVLRAQVMGDIHASVSLEFYKTDDLPFARKHWIKSMQYGPHHRKNLQTWKDGGRLLLDSRTKKLLRHVKTNIKL